MIRRSLSSKLSVRILLLAGLVGCIAGLKLTTA